MTRPATGLPVQPGTLLFSGSYDSKHGRFSFLSAAASQPPTCWLAPKLDPELC
jgi:hypothetical protein